MKNIPDLLALEPMASINRGQHRDALRFAFTTGDSAGALAELLDEDSAPLSDWDPECFAGDLFVEEFVSGALQVRHEESACPVNAKYLKSVLCHPPRELSATLFRQDIQRELLGDEDLLTQFRSSYRKLLAFRCDLDSVGSLGRVYFSRWRIDLLERLADAVDFMASSFFHAQSGLCRIRDCAQEFQQTQGYQQLKELLDYEDKLATVNLRLRMGADGRIRGFEIARIRENDTNRFHMGPIQRFFWRWGLLLRGFRLTGDELIERWVDSVFDALVDDLSYFLRLIGDMEFHLASLQFRSLCQSQGLEVCFPTFLEPGAAQGRSTKGLFNPLLLSEERAPVPCDLSTTRSDAIVIVTGPNSGGKTRLLQAVALLQLLGQAGFHAPASEARLRPASGMFVSLQEGAKADQKEGRLGMELLRIRRLFEESRPRALVVLDELCSGTNPSEGEEIFFLVISLLRELDPEAFVSTHFLRFAERLSQGPSDDGLEFLQVELDENQGPTFSFVPGVAGSSLARHIAARLGVTRQELLALIHRTGYISKPIR